MNCIVKDTFGIQIKELYQWDKNQVITVTMLPRNKFVNLQTTWDYVEVHFWNTNSKTATVVGGTFDRNSVTVKIPDSFLDEGLDIQLYVYVTKDTTSNTIASAAIPVVKRIEKEGEQP